MLLLNVAVLLPLREELYNEHAKEAPNLSLRCRPKRQAVVPRGTAMPPGAALLRRFAHKHTERTSADKACAAPSSLIVKRS